MGPRGKQPALVYEFSYAVGIALPVAFGQGHNGARLYAEATEGRAEGERLSGRVFGGGDWLLAGTDGWGRLDARTHIVTDDGAAIYAHYPGVVELNSSVMAAVVAGGMTGFEDQYFRTTPVFETGDERYAWLTQTVFVGVGHFPPGQVEYDVYRLT